MKVYIGISRDHSGSMRYSGLTAAAMRDYNKLIAGISNQATIHGVDTIASVVECGVNGVPGNVRRAVTTSSVTALQPMTKYVADGNSTPLYDSIGALIEQFERLPDANDNDVTFVLSIITDGGENASTVWSAARLRQRIAQLHNTDRWSITIRAPKGYGANITRDLGLHKGNVREWDTTDRGLTESSVETEQGFANYFSDVKQGKRSTQTFYTDVKNMSLKEVKAKLDDISAEVSLWTVQNDVEGKQISTFCRDRSGAPFLKGAAFYMLTKKEDEVQDYKQIAIRSIKGGQVYSGPAARQLLGLPAHGTTRVAPGDHGDYEIYIQSTSVNRKLPVGTRVLYWNKVGTAYKEGANAPVAAPAPLPPSNLTTAGTTRGAKTTFATNTTVAKKVTATVPAPVVITNGQREAYEAGYKDGRGKKKNRKAEYFLAELTQYVAGFADGKAKAPNKFAGLALTR